MKALTAIYVLSITVWLSWYLLMLVRDWMKFMFSDAPEWVRWAVWAGRWPALVALGLIWIHWGITGTSPLVNAVVTLLGLWGWWNSKDDDDWRRKQRRKVAEKVASVGHRLVVVPAGAR